MTARSRKTLAAIVLGVVASVAALALVPLAHAAEAGAAATCPSPQTLRGSPLVRDFREWVFSQYRLQGLDPSDQQLAFGHALGRVASAVRGDPEREAIFACLELAIEQQSIGETLGDDIERAIWPDPDSDALTGTELFRRIIHAAMGAYDREVAAATGISDVSPADAFFAALPRGTMVPQGAASQGTAAGASAGDDEAVEADTVSAADDEHPWDGLCLQQLHEAGYRPIFGLWTFIGVRGPVVYADPVSNDYVQYSSADPCNKGAWDWAEFYGTYEWVSDRYLGHDEDAVFWKVVTWKSKARNDIIRIRYYR